MKISRHKGRTPSSFAPSRALPLLLVLGLSFVFFCLFHLASQHFSLPLSSLICRTNWRFVGVHFCKATTPFRASPRALFVILITRAMSLASASRAYARTPHAQTAFICELIYYANYFSECAPRASRFACSFQEWKRRGPREPSFRTICPSYILSFLPFSLSCSRTWLSCFP